MSEKQHVIINEDRSITIPDELLEVGVQYDTNVNTITFDCPRYFDNVDLSKMAIYVNYKQSKDRLDSFKVANITVDAENQNLIHFDWTITLAVTEISGPFTFSVCAKTVDSDGNITKHWNTKTVLKMTVVEGLETTDQVTKKYPDIIQDVLDRTSEVVALVGDISTGLDNVILYQEALLNGDDA